MENSTFDLMYKVCNCGVHMYRHSGRVAQPHHIAVDEIDLSLPATLEVLEHRGFDISVEGNYFFNPRLIELLDRDIARPAAPAECRLQMPPTTPPRTSVGRPSFLPLFPCTGAWSENKARQGL